MEPEGSFAGSATSFAFVQLEFGFELGPPDGRYVVRDGPNAEPHRVVVLSTLAAPRGSPQRSLGSRLRRRPRTVTDAEPAPAPTARATLIDPAPLDATSAQERLARLREEQPELEAEAAEAIRELNRMLRAHRAAAADPHVREVAMGQALVVRAGHGDGEQVARGRFAEACELPASARRERRSRRSELLAPQERLAAMLTGREQLHAADELVLRARADVDAERPREAALQARIALEALLAELPAQAPDRAALEQSRDAISEAANDALTGDPAEHLSAAVADVVVDMAQAVRRRSLARERERGHPAADS